MDEADLDWSVEESVDAAELAVRGTLSVGTTSALSTVLRKLLLDRGRVLVDVSGLHLATPAAQAVFPAVLAAVDGWPLARLALFGADARFAAGMRARGTPEVWVARDRAQALELLDHRPPRVRRSTELPPTREAAALARSVVRSACADWDLGELEQRAVVVANELVTAAVEGGGGSQVLVISADRRGVTVSVQEGPAPGPMAAGGLGLRLVERLSDGWGVVEHRRGRAVWALLRSGGEA